VASDHTRRICLVLGTGRCGSTALSDVLRHHSDMLSVSELFSALRGRDLAEREMDGAEFWRLISTPLSADAVLHRWKAAPEVLYPIFAPRLGADRFAWPAALPPLVGVTLPHLTARPDDLYAVLEQAAPARPRRPLSEHLWWLFDALAGERRPSIVLERSGGSLGNATTLLKLFPDAQVIHMYRDGRECAVSMSRHPRFKLSALRAELGAELGRDLYGEDGQAGQAEATAVRGAVSSAMAGLAPDQITAEAFAAFEVPLSRYGLMWSAMVVAGIPALPGGTRRHDLDYQDFIEHPRESIGALLEFLGVTHGPACEANWAAAIRLGRDARAEVGEREWQELSRACRMGMNRLYGRGGWT
jgi:hypothetical protein